MDSTPLFSLWNCGFDLLVAVYFIIILFSCWTIAFSLIFSSTSNLSLLVSAHDWTLSISCNGRVVLLSHINEFSLQEFNSFLSLLPVLNCLGLVFPFFLSSGSPSHRLYTPCPESRDGTDFHIHFRKFWWFVVFICSYNFPHIAFLRDAHGYSWLEYFKLESTIPSNLLKGFPWTSIVWPEHASAVLRNHLTEPVNLC